MNTDQDEAAPDSSEIVKPEKVQPEFQFYSQPYSLPSTAVTTSPESKRLDAERMASNMEQEDIQRAKLASLASEYGNGKEHRPTARWQSLLKSTERDRIREVDLLTGEIGCETVIRLANEFAPIIEKDADTLLYIGPPPRAAKQDDHEYEHIKSHFYRPYLMQSETLRKVGSTQFNKFLGPMSARVERKLKKLEIHKRVMHPEKIKYYIDLRPMLDDEEALLILTELTSTPDILTWHTKSNKYGIPPELICGRDNLNVPDNPRHRWSLSSQDKDATMKHNDIHHFEPITIRPNEPEWKPLGEAKKSRERLYQDKIAALRQQAPEPDYSPIRHHVAIERLLHAIAGEDPKLDSAPKAWTYFSIAKYFDCANNPRVNSWITAWLLSSNNANFIQANPEVVYRLASGIHSPDMLRCTFAMLVGERALLRVQHPHSPLISKKSIHGRSFALLDDDDLNRIDHAVPSLIRRVKAVFDKLTNPDLPWASNSADSEKLKLDSIVAQNDHEQQVLDSVQNDLRDYVRRVIFSALRESLGQDLAKISDEFVHNRQIYYSLPLNARIYTQSFWSELRQRVLTSDEDTAAPATGTTWREEASALKAAGIISESEKIKFISTPSLFASFWTLNTILLERHRAIDVNGNVIPPASKSTSKLLNVDEYGRPVPRRPLGVSTYELDGVDEYGRPCPKPAHADKDWNAWAAYDRAHRHHQQELRALAISGEAHTMETTLPSRGRPETDNSTDLTPLGSSKWPDDSNTNAFASGNDHNDVFMFEHSEPSRTDIHTDDSKGKNFDDVNNDTYETPNPWEDIKGDSPVPMTDQVTRIAKDADGNRELTEPQMQPSQVLRLVPDEGLHARKASLPLRPAQWWKKSPSKEPGVPKAVHFPTPPSVIHDSFDTWPSEDASEPREPKTVNTLLEVQDTFAEADRRSTTAIDESRNVPAMRKSAFKDDSYDLWKQKEFGLISVPSLLQQLSTDLSQCIWRDILDPGYVADGSCDLDIPTREIDTLLCLTDDEWKYLPLWAGGFDDGSGGVFASDELGGGDLPDALDIGEGGFRGGPTAGLLSSGAPTEVADSVCMVDVSDLGDEEDEFVDIKTEEGVSTVGKASRVATDGTRDCASTVMSLDE